MAKQYPLDCSFSSLRNVFLANATFFLIQCLNAYEEMSVS